MGRTCVLPKLKQHYLGHQVTICNHEYWLDEEEIEMLFSCSRGDAAEMLEIEESEVGEARRELRRQYLILRNIWL